MDHKVQKYFLHVRLTESSNTKGNQGRKALITGQLHQTSILCLTKVQQLARRKQEHSSHTKKTNTLTGRNKFKNITNCNTSIYNYSNCNNSISSNLCVEDFVLHHIKVHSEEARLQGGAEGVSLHQANLSVSRLVAEQMFLGWDHVLQHLNKKQSKNKFLLLLIFINNIIYLVSKPRKC